MRLFLAERIQELKVLAAKYAHTTRELHGIKKLLTLNEGVYEICFGEEDRKKAAVSSVNNRFHRKYDI